MDAAREIWFLLDFWPVDEGAEDPERVPPPPSFDRDLAPILERSVTEVWSPPEIGVLGRVFGRIGLRIRDAEALRDASPRSLYRIDDIDLAAALHAFFRSAAIDRTTGELSTLSTHTASTRATLARWIAERPLAYGSMLVHLPYDGDYILTVAHREVIEALASRSAEVSS
jgi:hypothetical protein